MSSLQTAQAPAMAADSSPRKVNGSTSSSPQHTSDTFRPLVKKLALAFDLGLLPSVSRADASSPATAPAQGKDKDEGYPSRKRPPGQPLTSQDLYSLFEHLADLNFTSSHANHAQIGAALTALRMTGLDRDPEALAIVSEIFLKSCLRIEVNQNGASRDKGKQRNGESAEEEEYDGLVDIVGTGGDGQDTFNVSTTAAMVAAGVPGVRVCKHGAKASSSTSGSVDLLNSLGIPLSILPPSSIPNILPRSSFSFLYAQLFHPSLGPMAPIRRALAFPTIFNVLGPLINPAQPRRCVLGVHSYNLGRTYAEALKRRGNIERAWVVCGREGLDEISCEGPTDVWELDANGEIKEFTVEPLRDFGLPPHPLKHVGSFSSDENASIVLRLLSQNEATLPAESLQEPLNLSEDDIHPPGGLPAPASGAHSNGDLVQEQKSYPPIPAGAHLRAIADYTLIQAAALLHVAGKSSSLKKCVELARESMRSGSARRALETFRMEAASEIRKVEEAAEARRRQQQAQADMERRKRQMSSDAVNRDSRAELQDSFSYFPNPSRDANVGTED